MVRELLPSDHWMIKLVYMVGLRLRRSSFISRSCCCENERADIANVFSHGIFGGAHFHTRYRNLYIKTTQKHEHKHNHKQNCTLARSHTHTHTHTHTHAPIRVRLQMNRSAHIVMLASALLMAALQGAGAFSLAGLRVSTGNRLPAAKSLQLRSRSRSKIIVCQVSVCMRSVCVCDRNSPASFSL